MSARPSYTLYHPKWYRRRVSVWWWLKRSSYAGFVLRELTSVAVALFALVMLVEVRSIAQGPEAYTRFQARLGTPLLLGFHLVAFLLVVIHSITWFNLAPKAMVLRLQGKRLPDWAVAGLNYAAWLVLSAAVAAIFLR